MCVYVCVCVRTRVRVASEDLLRCCVHVYMAYVLYNIPWWLKLRPFNQTSQPPWHQGGWPKVIFWEFDAVDFLGITSFTTQ